MGLGRDRWVFVLLPVDLLIIQYILKIDLVINETQLNISSKITYNFHLLAMQSRGGKKSRTE